MTDWCWLLNKDGVIAKQVNHHLWATALFLPENLLFLGVVIFMLGCYTANMEGEADHSLYWRLLLC